MRSRDQTVSTLLLRPLLAWLGGRGHSTDDLLRQARIDPATMADLGARLPSRCTEALWRHAVAKTGDPALGLHVAETVDLGSLGVLGYLGRSSATIGEALELGSRYWRLLTDASELEVSVEGERAVARFAQPLPSFQAIGDYRVALLVFLGRALTGRTLPLVGVHLPHRRPADSSEYVRILGVEPHFRADFEGVSVPREVLGTKVSGADPDLRAILESRATDLLARLPATEGFVARVRSAVAAELEDASELSLEAVAARMSMPPGTLRRRLRAERASYQRLADDVRQRLAVRYLADGGLNVSEVAMRLGFGDLSAFSRAYKRWTGVSPSGRRAPVRKTFATRDSQR